MRVFALNYVAVVRRQLWDAGKLLWVLGDEGAFPEIVGKVGQVEATAKLVDVGHELFLGASLEWVLHDRRQVFHVVEAQRAAPTRRMLDRLRLV